MESRMGFASMDNDDHFQRWAHPINPELNGRLVIKKGKLTLEWFKKNKIESEMPLMGLVDLSEAAGYPTDYTHKLASLIEQWEAKYEKPYIENNFSEGGDK